MLNSTFQEDNPSFKAIALSKTCLLLPSTSTECSLPQNLSWRDKSKPSPQTTSVLKPHALKQACRGLSEVSHPVTEGSTWDSHCSPMVSSWLVRIERMYLLVQAWNPRGQ